MNHLRTTRRQFLSASGVCLALPWLEAFADAAPAAQAPKRAVFVFVPNGVNMWEWHPATTGKIRLNVIDALAKLADAKSEATFIAALGDADEEVRLAAADGLAKAGLPSAAKPLLAAAEAAKGWQRIQLTKFCLVLAEKLAAAGKKPEARQIYEQLKATRTADNERHVRDFAEIGLKAIA